MKGFHLGYEAGVGLGSNNFYKGQGVAIGIEKKGDEAEEWVTEGDLVEDGEWITVGETETAQSFSQYFDKRCIQKTD